MTRKRVRRSALEYLEQRAVPSTVRTIVYDQITSFPSSNPLQGGDPYEELSADGTKVVFAVGTNGSVPQVYTANSDGSGQTLVDPNGSPVFYLSKNGSVVLESINHGDAGIEYRIVNGNGTNLHDAFTAANLEEFANGILSADGSTVFFTADAPFPITGQSQPDPPGLYAVAASGTSAPQLIVSEAQVASLLGSSVGAVDIGNSGGDNALGVSSDGSKLVFCAGTANAGEAELTVNRADNVPHLLSLNPAFITAAGISADGTKVFVDESAFAGSHTVSLTVFNFDGSNPVPINVVDITDNAAGGQEHIQLTQDGSHLLLGSSSLLINTDNSGAIQIGTDVANSTIRDHNAILSHATMNSSGTEFLYAMTDGHGAPQLSVAHLNPASLGVDPAISNVTITPPFIVIAPGSPTTTTISAQVSPATVNDVNEALQYNGISSNGLVVNGNTVDLLADQQLNASGGGIYTNTNIGTEGTVPGPRTVRVIAESLDTSGLLHATAVEVSGLTVVTHRQVPGDFDGDGKTDTAAYDQTTTTFYELFSGGGAMIHQFGNPAHTNIPVAGDFDGDGKTDTAAYDQTTATFYELFSGGGARIRQFGNPLDKNIPVAGDFDGDRKTDTAIYDQTTATFYVLYSAGGAKVLQFGNRFDKNVPIAGDFDGDGKTDFAIYDQTTATFYELFSGGGARILQFGNPAHSNIPVAADFDGDGKTDTAVYDPTTSTFFELFSGGGARILQFGDPSHTNVPIPAPYVAQGLRESSFAGFAGRAIGSPASAPSSLLGDSQPATRTSAGDLTLTNADCFVIIAPTRAGQSSDAAPSQPTSATPAKRSQSLLHHDVAIELLAAFD